MTHLNTKTQKTPDALQCAEGQNETHLTADSEEKTMTIVPPCPPWCDMPPGHPYEPEGFRVHERLVFANSGLLSARISQYEEVVTVREPIGLDFGGDLEGVEYVKAGEARDLADLLVRAADELEFWEVQ